MKKFLNLVFIGVVGFGFAGCGSEEVKTVNYYNTHVDERETKIKECSNNPGAVINNPNCINAKESSFKARFDNNVDTSFLRSTAPNPNEKK